MIRFPVITQAVVVAIEALIEVQVFRVQEFVEETRPSFTNSRVVPSQRAILAPSTP